MLVAEVKRLLLLLVLVLVLLNQSSGISLKLLLTAFSVHFMSCKPPRLYPRTAVLLPCLLFSSALTHWHQAHVGRVARDQKGLRLGAAETRAAARAGGHLAGVEAHTWGQESRRGGDNDA